MDLLGEIRALRDSAALSLDTDETFGAGDPSPDLAAQSLAIGEIGDLIAAASDADLRAAYVRSSREPGDFEADVLAAECEQRGIAL
jgi:hypothetical protein